MYPASPSMPSNNPLTDTVFDRLAAYPMRDDTSENTMDT
jgi:hypothetical protein